MKIEQIYTGCLAHAAYYIESKGEAALFDPLREVQPYMDRAAKDHATIKYVFETHFHADFVSGHLELNRNTGAQIVFGPLALPSYNAIVASDGQEFKVGDYTIKLIHTPGHTMESSCYLLMDEKGKQQGIITGDTLFIGDVGRPDLAQHVVADLTEDKLARLLFHSLRDKIMPLSDDLIIYPNHGAGSACGKNMSRETTDTLGHQKKVNYALQPMTEDQFVAAVLNGLTAPPGYFPKNVLMNISGYESQDKVMERALRPLNVNEFEFAASQMGKLILDTRSPGQFAEGFIPGSLNIGLNGNFAQIMGDLVADIDQEVLIVAEEGKEEEAVIRLSRIGYDHSIGYLKGGFDAWYIAGKDIDTVHRITARELEEKFKQGPLLLFDVRKEAEFEAMHISGARNIPLQKIKEHLNEFPTNRHFYIYCAGGYRSMIAASVLKRAGFDNFSDVQGGFASIKETRIPKNEFESSVASGAT